MKKSFGIFGLLFLIPLLVSAQLERSKYLDNTFYFRAGISNPVSTFGGPLGYNYTDNGTYGFYELDISTGMGAEMGYKAEIGGIIYLANFSNNASLGLDFGVDAARYKLSLHKLLRELFPAYTLSREEYSPFWLASFKAGPIVSVSTQEEMVLDFYYKLNPTYSWYGAGFDISMDSPVRQGFRLKLDDAGFGIKHSLGVNFRYRAFMIGAELNAGKLSFGKHYYRKYPVHTITVMTGVNF